MKVRCIGSMALLLALSACSQSSVDTNAEGEKLMQTSREWSRVAGTDSLEKILSYWAEDAVVLPPGFPPVKGKEAIKNMLIKNAQIPGFKISWEPISASVSKSGDMAFLMEQNQITVNDSTGKSIITINKGVTVWKKESDGSWKNIVDTWNAAPSK